MKAENAVAAGATGVVVMNEGTAGRTDGFSGLLNKAVGVPVVFLGVLPLPDFVPRDKSFGDEVWKPLHEIASWLLAVVVVVHVAAAFKHHFIERDRLLVRMWPWWPSRRQA